jgi:tetratricopeptide (TPR) repeat protein
MKHRNKKTAHTASQLLDDAKLNIKKCNYYEALHNVNAYLLFNQHSEEGLLIKGLCYLYLAETDKARFLFDVVMEQNKDNAFAYYCYAEYYKLNLDYKIALAHVNTAICIDEENTIYYRLAVELSFFMGELENAYTLINRAIVVNPFKEDLYFWRAMILAHMHKYTVAIHDLTRAIGLEPAYADAYRLKAKLMLKTGQRANAIKDLHKARQLERLASEHLSSAA